ncbi:MAG: hypothetical protein ABEI78_00475 [Candidatus Nanohaloarchaea archaeon]
MESLDEISEAFLNAAEDNEEILDKPEPEIKYKEIEEEKPVINLEYWVKDTADAKKIKSSLYKHFLDNENVKNILKDKEADK